MGRWLLLHGEVSARDCWEEMAFPAICPARSGNGSKSSLTPVYLHGIIWFCQVSILYIRPVLSKKKIPEQLNTVQIGPEISSGMILSPENTIGVSNLQHELNQILCLCNINETAS